MDMDLVLEEVEEQEHSGPALAETIEHMQAVVGGIHRARQRTNVPAVLPGGVDSLSGLEREAHELLARLTDLQHEYIEQFPEP